MPRTDAAGRAPEHPAADFTLTADEPPSASTAARVRQPADLVPLPKAVAELLELSDERDRQLERRSQSWAEGWLWGFAAGYEAGERDVLAAEAAFRREAAGLVPGAAPGTRSQPYDELERIRWFLRGEPRTRATFADPHPDDFKGRDGAA